MKNNLHICHFTELLPPVGKACLLMSAPKLCYNFFTINPEIDEVSPSASFPGKTRIKTMVLYQVFMSLIIIFTGVQSSFATVTGPGSAWQFCRKITLSAATPSADFQVKVTLAAGQYGKHEHKRK